MLSGSSERKSSIFPSVASFTHWLMFARSSSCFPVSFTGFAPKSLSDCSRKSSLMGNPAHNRSQAHPRAGASNSHLGSTCLPKAKPPFFPLFTGGRTVPGQLTAIITYPSADIFWQPVELSQGLGSGRDGSVGGEGRSLCSRVTLLPSSAAFGSEHLKRTKWAETQALGSFSPHCPLPPSHILMMNMATDP